MATNSRSTVYGQRSNLGPFANFTETKGKAVDGNNDKTLRTRTLLGCKIACANEKSFYCKSFDYYYSNCYLSKVK
jgi:hypothetical protein